jgi:hypothetical protein
VILGFFAFPRLVGFSILAIVSSGWWYQGRRPQPETSFRPITAEDSRHSRGLAYAAFFLALGGAVVIAVLSHFH